MTGRESCVYMVSIKRVIKLNDQIQLFREDGKPSTSIKKNRDRLYWHVKVLGKYMMLPISKLTWLAHGNSLEYGKTIDHIDRNPKNNSIHNLRLATPAEQSQNRLVSRTDPFVRAQIRSLIKKRQISAPALAKYMQVNRRIIYDVINMKYKYDQQLGKVG